MSVALSRETTAASRAPTTERWFSFPTSASAFAVVGFGVVVFEEEEEDALDGVLAAEDDPKPLGVDAGIVVVVVVVVVVVWREKTKRTRRRNANRFARRRDATRDAARSRRDRGR